MAYKNPEDIVAYRKAHRAEARECARLWRLKNPGKGAEKAREWRKKNPDKALETQQAYRKANRDKVREDRKAWLARTDYYNSPQRKAQSRKDWLRKYGLTPSRYDEMLAAQGGGCALCGTSGPRRRNAKNLYVDHCHSSGSVRGLLCFPCNTMLGNASDSPGLLREAANYLERPR